MHLPSSDVLAYVVDAHCHPTDSATPDDAFESLQINLCSMSTRIDDQVRVKRLAENWPDKVIPCFGG